MEHFTVNLRLGRTRRVVEDGREFLVAPMTTITADGVLPGSQGPLLYPSAETISSVPQWDGTPITVKHPFKDGRHVSAAEVPEQHIGELRNSRWEGKLVHEGWFDVQLTKAADKRVYDALIHHKPLEVSTGLYTTNVPAINGQGLSPHGRSYAATATRYQPDHLAILPDEVGACSLNDGCGLMVNANPKGCNQWTGPGCGTGGKSKLKGKGTNDGGRAADGAGRAGRGSDAAQPQDAGRRVAGKAGRAGRAADGAAGSDQDRPSDRAAVAAALNRLDRYKKVFKAKGHEQAAEWMDALKDHIKEVGPDAALESLAESRSGKARYEGKVQYEGAYEWFAETDKDHNFVKDYLNKAGIIVVQQDTVLDPNLPHVSSWSEKNLKAEGRDRSNRQPGDVIPTDQTFKNKLEESKHLPGLEKTEDINKLLGRPVTHFDKDTVARLDKEFGKGQWIVKSYGDEAYAGYGVFFPQRLKQIERDSRATIAAARSELRDKGFTIARDEEGRPIGVKRGKEVSRFNSEEFDGLPKRVQTLGRQVQQAAHSERGARLPQSPQQSLENDYGVTFQRDKDGVPVGITNWDGKQHKLDSKFVKRFEDQDGGQAGKALSRALAADEWERQGHSNEPKFMVQPAFKAVGVSDYDRAMGNTFETATEGRVHVMTTKDGKVSVIPHATLASRQDAIPVVFHDENTRAMEKAVQEAIAKLPASERTGQLYAPDAVKTKDGWKVVELNPSAEGGGSDWLGRNPFVIDAVASHVAGRDPMHAKFVRDLLETAKIKPADRAKLRAAEEESGKNSPYAAVAKPGAMATVKAIKGGGGGGKGQTANANPEGCNQHTGPGCGQMSAWNGEAHLTTKAAYKATVKASGRRKRLTIGGDSASSHATKALSDSIRTETAPWLAEKHGLTRDTPVGIVRDAAMDANDHEGLKELVEYKQRNHQTVARSHQTAAEKHDDLWGMARDEARAARHKEAAAAHRAAMKAHEAAAQQVTVNSADQPRVPAGKPGGGRFMGQGRPGGVRTVKHGSSEVKFTKLSPKKIDGPHLNLANYKQHDDHSCSFVAAMAVAHHFDKSVSPKEVLKAVRPSKSGGMDRKGVQRGMRELGIEAKYVKDLTVAKLKKHVEAGTPVMLTVYPKDWTSDHYTVVQGFSEGGKRIHLSNYRSMAVKEFEQEWFDKGEGLICTQRPKPVKNGMTDPVGWWHQLAEQMGIKSEPVLTANPAVSEAQRRFLNATKGHGWVKEHGFDNEGKLPARVVKPAKNELDNSLDYGDDQLEENCIMATNAAEEVGEMNANQKASWWRRLGESLGMIQPTGNAAEGQERHSQTGRFEQHPLTAVRRAADDLNQDGDPGAPAQLVGTGKGEERNTVKVTRLTEPIDVDGDGDGADDDQYGDDPDESEAQTEPGATATVGGKHVNKGVMNSTEDEEMETCPDCGGQLAADGSCDCYEKPAAPVAPAAPAAPAKKPNPFAKKVTNMIANELHGLTGGERRDRLQELRPSMIRALSVNCDCQTERVALNGLSDETLLTLITANAKAEGSNADVTGDPGFKGKQPVGGEEDETKKAPGLDWDDSESDAEAEPLKTGGKGATPQVRGRVANRRMTRDQWLAAAPPEVVEEHRLVQNILHGQKTAVIRKLVGHLPRERQTQVVNSMGLMTKTLDELKQLLILQRPQHITDNGWEQPQVPTPSFLGGQTLPPVGNGAEPTVNAELQSDVDCMNPPTINFKQWQQEDRATGGRGAKMATSEADAM